MDVDIVIDVTADCSLEFELTNVMAIDATDDDFVVVDDVQASTIAVVFPHLNVVANQLQHHAANPHRNHVVLQLLAANPHARRIAQSLVVLPQMMQL